MWSLLRKRFPEPTIVALRSSRVPAQIWEDRVNYDAWGRPYTRNEGMSRRSASFGTIVLLPDGRTNETYIYGTEWRHKSGPPVTFAEAPKSLFPTA